MKGKFIIISFVFLSFGCKSAKKKAYLKKCERTIVRPKININTYDELINYGNDTHKKVELIFLDAVLVDKTVLNRFIFNNKNNYLVDFKSYLDVGTDGFDSPTIRVLSLKSNLCGSLVRENGKYLITD
ncbi:hypothetical protein [uncultured Olleya sp.]|uniref:hypothetical protein n=1 Tax=uncultured Olleya sp. TaxID=757243 RepID=UPI0025995403|nr:hypothetical protein [uncultured Olleya sp.]